MFVFGCEPLTHECVLQQTHFCDLECVLATQKSVYYLLQKCVYYAFLFKHLVFSVLRMFILVCRGKALVDPVRVRLGR